MNNPFPASRDEMNQLFVESRKKFAKDFLEELKTRYSYEEVVSQTTAQAGPVVDELNRALDGFARDTDNVEFATALGLSDFYFGPDAKTTISFEMNRNFKASGAMTYEELIAGMEKNTHIDCAIAGDGKSLNFQIKRYPQAHLEHTNEAFLAGLDVKVFEYYANMGGTILVVVLQQNSPPTQTAFRFTELSEELQARKAKITFDEVVLLYTDYSNGKKLAVLHKLYPEHKRIVAPMEWMLKRFRGEL